MRQYRIRSSEKAASSMFREGRSIFVVDSVDEQVTCVWVAE